MTPYQWIYLLIGSGMVSLVLFGSTLIMDSRLVKRLKKNGRGLSLNWILFLLGLCFFALAVWGYVDIQKQISLLS